MPNVIIQAQTAHVENTGIAFMVYANRYQEASLALLRTSLRKNKFDPVIYYLFCLSLKLHLKSFIWLTDRINSEKIRKKYWHNIEKLWKDAKLRGINKYAPVTPLRDHVINLVGPHYRKRQFNYLDLDMVFNGYANIRSEPRVIHTLSRLTARLSMTLETPVAKASS